MQVGSASGEVAPDAAIAQGNVVRSKQDIASQLTNSNNESSSGILGQLTGNPFFTAGFGLAALGAAATLAQRGVKRGASLLRQRLLVDVEINIKDDSYPWFLYWMTQHERRQLLGAVENAENAQKLGIVDRVIQRLVPRMRHLAIETSKQELPNGAVHTHFALIPGPGQHFIRYKNAVIHVNRQRKENSLSDRPFETTTLTTLYSQRHVFEEIFREAHGIARSAVEGKTIIYNAWGTQWQQFGTPRRKRPLESVILEKGVKERIVDDVQDFIDSNKWYADRGIPYRRGYLLYGPPGTGKSSFIQALAGQIDYNIAIVNVSERGLTDDKLNHLLLNLPQRTIALLEDVDAAFANRRQVDEQGYSGANVTFSGLLNALDGVASAEERILFLTTNHVERLDSALVRPGRVDMTVRLGEATAYQIIQLWDRFYSEDDPDRIKKQLFMQRLLETQVLSDLNDNTKSSTSTAALQGLFLYNKGNPDGAIEMAWQLTPGETPGSVAFEQSKPNDD